MSEEKQEYNIEKAKRDNAILKKYAAIQKASEDKIGCQKIYVDMTDDIKAALVLDEIIFFTLPRATTGKSALRIFKNGYLWMAVRRSEWWDRKRLKKREADLAIEKLEKLNLIIKAAHRFNSLPTVHLRLNVDTFFKMYFEALERENPPENENDTQESDINDLYEMMGMPFSPNGNLPNWDSRLPKRDESLQNGDSINSPYISDTQPQPDDFSEPKQGTAYNRGEQERPNSLDEWLKMANMPGAKESARIDALLSAFGVAFVVNSETAEWKKFAKYAISEQKLKGWQPERFIAWVKAQKGYPEFWPCRRMMENYPKAFVESELQQQSPKMKDGSGYV